MSKENTIKWTQDQSRVIDTDHRNILVSAAAGSGKTAVLVARLMKKLTDPENPADIDQFLIVTFTKAAAAQMKEKIGKEISKALDENPEDDHLRRQQMLLGRAKITTIDSFCSYVVKNYAGRIDLDPSFRQGEDGELKLMEKDVMRSIMEEAYESDDEAFLKDFYLLMDSYAPDGDESRVEKLIKKVYDMAMSTPYPEEWLSSCTEITAASDFSELEKTKWMQMLEEEIANLVRDGAALAKDNYLYVGSGDIAVPYEKMAVAYMELFEQLTAAHGSYEDIFNILSNFEKPKLVGARGGDKVIQEEMKARRDKIEKNIKQLQEEYVFAAPGIALQLQNESARPINTLLEMVHRFWKGFDEAKRKKNIVDFADTAHYALQILRGEDKKRTDAAREQAAIYREVMIDEYQDSNYLQEEILTAVSSIEDGVDNYFCVGDVKQSIYRFRNARPELFMQKFHDYENENGGTRIDLRCNFRSRPEILDFCNDIFRMNMRNEVGGIDYDQAAALVAGRDKKEDLPCLLRADGTQDTAVEVMAVASKMMEGQDDEENLEKNELEARAIGERIHEMIHNESLHDPEKGDRPLEYRDIAILFRNLTKVDVYLRTLENMGIPVVSVTKEGFFDTMEIMTILNYLSILDNPRQDIPFASVMHSPIGGFSAEDLVSIKTCQPSMGSRADVEYAEEKTESEKYAPSSLCDWMEYYLQNGEDEGLKQRIFNFMESLEHFRKLASCTYIHELLNRILRETGYGDYVAALPDGRKRMMNIHMLIEKAIDFENTSYVGLFNFVRYITNLKKYEVNIEAASAGEAENAVRIVTIHKSKGLEYPVVFLAGMDARMNMRDLTEDVLIHPDLGIASCAFDLEKRRKFPAFKRSILKRKMKDDDIGEELRILYVGLTRAKLKLIVSGSMNVDTKTGEMKLDSYEIEPEKNTGFLPASYIRDSITYWKLLMPCILKAYKEDQDNIILKCIKPDDLITANIQTESRRVENLQTVFERKTDEIKDENLYRAINERYSFEYAYGNREAIPAKLSVSDLKIEGMEDEEAKKSFEPPVVMPLIPDFMKENEEEKRPRGSDVGTAYHSILASLDLTDDKIRSDEGMKAVIEKAAKDGFIEGDVVPFISRRKIRTFVGSELGQRMGEALKKGVLHREQPFTMRIPSSRVDATWPDEEDVLIQGIIDAYFEEDGKIILMDYKTDKVDDAETLIKRYHVQLDLYAEALSRATGLSVSEVHIYSFCLDRDIVME